MTRVVTTTIALETSKGNLPLALALGMILMLLVLTVNATAMVIQDTARPACVWIKGMRRLSSRHAAHAMTRAAILPLVVRDLCYEIGGKHSS